MFSASPYNYDLGIPLDEAVIAYIEDELDGKITAADYGETDGEITVKYAVSYIFSDVAENAWYKDYVQAVYDKGIMTGMTGSAFGPDVAMTRGMFVTMLYRIENSPPVNGNVSETFSDCADGQWYSDAVLWAYQNGIVDGLGSDTFGPSVQLTRQQMATILYRYALYSGADEIIEAALPYSDAADVADWALSGVSFCTIEGLMNGVSENAFDPAGTANRSMGAAVMFRTAA